MTADVAIVGGGPAGSVLAALLARRGRRVIVLERAPAYRWRACGVFTSPAAVAELRRAGVAATELGRVARPIPAMRVEAPGAPAFRLTYGDDGSLGAPAVGFDRRALDPLLLGLARGHGGWHRFGNLVQGLVREPHGVFLQIEEHADKLRDLAILYAPDFVINAGGLINVEDELRGYDRERAMKKVEGIYKAMQLIFALSRERGMSTAKAAREFAEERIRKISRIRLVRVTEYGPLSSHPTPNH